MSKWPEYRSHQMILSPCWFFSFIRKFSNRISAGQAFFGLSTFYLSTKCPSIMSFMCILKFNRTQFATIHSHENWENVIQHFELNFSSPLNLLVFLFTFSLSPSHTHALENRLRNSVSSKSWIRIEKVCVIVMIFLLYLLSISQYPFQIRRRRPKLLEKCKST